MAGCAAQSPATPRRSGLGFTFSPPLQQSLYTIAFAKNDIKYVCVYIYIYIYIYKHCTDTPIHGPVGYGTGKLGNGKIRFPHASPNTAAYCTNGGGGVQIADLFRIPRLMGATSL